MTNKNKKNDKFNKFYKEFSEMNQVLINSAGSLLNNNNKLLCHNLIIYGCGDDELVLPHSYGIVKETNMTKDREKSTYICDKRGTVICGISYFDSESNAICKYPKENIQPYKEHILEHASIITEEYLGKDKEDYLKLAILKMMEGNYNYFTKYDNTRFKLVLIQRSKIPRVMLSTLERNNIEVNSSSIAPIIDSYTNYIKSKVNKYSDIKTSDKILKKSR